MKKYKFEIRENGYFQSGILINVPEDLTIENVKERMNNDNLFITVETEKNPDNFDIIIDWDYINCDIDPDVDVISSCLYDAFANDSQNELVYIAMQYIKEQQCSISDAMLYASNKIK